MHGQDRDQVRLGIWLGTRQGCKFVLFHVWEACGGDGVVDSLKWLWFLYMGREDCGDDTPELARDGAILFFFLQLL